MSFRATIDDLPNHPQDIDVTVHVGGCRMNPKFFPFSLDDVSATVRYARSSVQLADFQARHGKHRPSHWKKEPSCSRTRAASGRGSTVFRRRP